MVASNTDIGDVVGQSPEEIGFRFQRRRNCVPLPRCFRLLVAAFVVAAAYCLASSHEAVFAAGVTPVASGVALTNGAPHDQTYHIAAGDTISIEVLNKPEFTRVMTILSDGKVEYPYVGQVQASGHTVAELTGIIEASLAKQMKSPQVLVSVVKRREARVAVLGAVRSPGKFDLEDGWRVLDLLAESGGLKAEDRPEWVQTTLVRGETGTAVPVDLVRLLATGESAENPMLAPGDVLLVQEKDETRTKVQVVGAVAKPGLVAAPLDGSVTTAIISVGGFAPRARVNEAVIRRDGNSIPVDLSNLGPDGLAKSRADNSSVSLQPGDTLMIPENVLSYTVLGAVATPGMREYPEKRSVSAVAALLSAGGARPDGDLKHATLARMSPTGNPVLTPINLADAMKNQKTTVASSTMELQPGDVLYIPSREPARNSAYSLRDILAFVPVAGLFIR